jgi:hypothetical protein
MERLSFTKYIAAAHEAERYVASKMDLGAHDSVGNMFSKAIIGNIAVKMAVGAVRANVDARMKLRRRLDPNARNPANELNARPEDWKAYIDEMAFEARSMGAGNCGEQAALAFKYLEERGIRPLDYVAIRTHGDHAFVVLGSTVPIQPNNFADWSVEGVVCDAWGKWVAIAGKLAVKYPRSTFQSQFHLE